MSAAEELPQGAGAGQVQELAGVVEDELTQGAVVATVPAEAAADEPVQTVEAESGQEIAAEDELAQEGTSEDAPSPEAVPETVSSPDAVPETVSSPEAEPTIVDADAVVAAMLEEEALAFEEAQALGATGEGAVTSTAPEVVLSDELSAEANLLIAEVLGTSVAEETTLQQASQDVALSDAGLPADELPAAVPSETVIPSQLVVGDSQALGNGEGTVDRATLAPSPEEDQATAEGVGEVIPVAAIDESDTPANALETASEEDELVASSGEPAESDATSTEPVVGAAAPRVGAPAVDEGAYAAVRLRFAELSSTNPQDWYPVFRARHGMLAVLRALARVRGKVEVITQLLTCCMAVNPILAAGLEPRYGDIDASTLALDPHCLPMSDRTGAVVLQHTFGIIDMIGDAALAEAAYNAQALLVEDSAHCVGQLSRDVLGQPFADVSVHSLGVGKMAQSSFGGAIWVNPLMMDKELRAAIVEELQGLRPVAPRYDRATTGYDTRLRVLTRLPDGMRRALWNPLAKTGVFVPAVTTKERAGEVFLEPALPGRHTLEQMEQALGGLPDVEERARVACRVYADELGYLTEAGLIPEAALAGSQALMRFPLVLASHLEADALIDHLGVQGHYCDSWGRPLLFPGVLDEGIYHFDGDLAALPATQRCSSGIVPLMTSVTPAEARETAEIVLAWISR